MITSYDAEPVVVLDGDILHIESLTVEDADVAAFVERTPEPDRPRVVADGLRFGLIAMRNVGTTVNTDFVEREFERLLARVNAANELAQDALEVTLRDNFGDESGRLPRLLEEFLGDRGKLRLFVADLFDENRRDSAMGRLRDLLDRYFDGDGAILATLLDPTRQGSPLHQFRIEIAAGFKELGEQLAALEAATTARADERSRGTAKGRDFEDLIEARLGQIARGSGDILERTSTIEGAILRCKKGDFVITLDPGRTGATRVRVVVECKNGVVQARKLADEIAEARENREAVTALVIFEPAQAPAGVAPLQIIGNDVYCVVGTEDDLAVLELAVRMARLLALLSLRDRAPQLHADLVLPAVQEIRDEIKALGSVKATLTNMQRCLNDGASSVYSQLERAQQRVLTLVARIEEAMAATSEVEELSA